jgi:Protein of unknown function (DUF3277)
MSVLSVYSGRDLNVAIVNEALGVNISAAGIAGSGLAKFTVRMTVDRSNLQVGMDGAVVPSVVPGEQGEFEMEVWQTSTLQQELLAWYNACKTAESAGDVSNWFGATLLAVSITDGSSHNGTGVAIMKVPDKNYDVQAGRVAWRIVSANTSNQ